jgi:hypothetical protein
VSESYQKEVVVEALVRLQRTNTVKRRRRRRHSRK